MFRPTFLPALAAGVAMLLIACGGDPTGPGSGGTRGVSYVAGNNGSDTVGAQLAQALIVEVRDGNGTLQPHVVVRFESTNSIAQPAMVVPSRLDATGSSGYYYSPAVVVDTTDANGRARAMVRMSSLAGPAILLVRVPELGYQDTARFVVKPGNVAAIVFSAPDTALLTGGQYNVGANTRDRYGNKRSGDPVTYRTKGVVSSVDASGLVRGLAPGVERVVATSGTVSDSARVAVVPDFTLNLVYASAAGSQVGTVRTDGSALTGWSTVSSYVMLPTMTADGAKTVFYEGDPGTNALIYAVDRQHVRRSIVAPTTELTTMSQPRVTGDGVWAYFTGYFPYNGTATRWGYTLWRAHLDGTGLERLTDGSGYVSHSMASPSPDGTKVVFVNSGVLSVLDLATRTVTSLGLRGSLPRFSPDGRRICYLAPSNYSQVLFTANADGSNPQQLSTANRYYETYAAPDFSPDGQWIVVRGFQRLELWRLSDGVMIELPFSATMYQPSFKPAA